MNTNKIFLLRLLSFSESITKRFFTTAKTLSQILYKPKNIGFNSLLILGFALGSLNKINAQVTFSGAESSIGGWYQDPITAMTYAPLTTNTAFATVGSGFSNASGFLSLQASGGSTFVNMSNVSPDLAAAKAAGKFYGAVITPNQIIRPTSLLLGYGPNGGGNYTFNAVIYDPTDNSETLIYSGAASTVNPPTAPPQVAVSAFKTMLPGINYQYRIYPTSAGGGTKVLDNIQIYAQAGTCPTGIAAPNPTGANYNSSTNAVIIPNGSTTANLSGITASNPNTNYPVISWHTGTPATSANRITNITSVASGTYYAAFATGEGACYSNTRAVCIGNDNDSDGVPNNCDLDDDNDGILDIAECTGGINVALSSSGAVASQSSTFSPYTADKAIDGNTAGTGAGNNIAHTNNTTSTEYWQVDLGSNKTISTINIFNRDDGNQDRLTNVYVLVSDTPFPANATNLAGALANADFTFQVGTVTATNADQTITVPNIVGRYVRIQKSGNNIASGDPNVLNFAEIQVFSCADTDGDGLINSLDTDSDNDGCPDAIEGAGTITYSQLNSNNQITGSVDSNGVPTVASGGQAVGSSTNSTVTALECSTCNVGNPAFIDSDGDGIGNDCDYDDDNDGIRDLAECVGYVGQINNGVWKGTTTSNLTITATTTIDKLNNTWLFNDNQTNFSTGAPYEGNIAKTGNTSITYTFSTPIKAKELAFALYDIDANIDPLVANGSWQISVNGVTGGSLTPYFSVANMTWGWPQLNYNLANGLVTVKPTGDNQAIMFKGYGDQLISSFTVTSSNLNSSGDYIGYFFYALNPCDTDNDGLNNSLDLDSDNDGCLDAIEGGANITASQLVTSGGTVSVGTGSTASNQNLCAANTCVNSNGIPQLSPLPTGYSNTTGQTVGGSSDGIQSSACITVCYETPTNLTSSVPVKHGITVLGRAGADNGNWPMLRNSAYTALEGKTKGFVVTRNSSPETTITNPVVGMMVFDTNEGATGCLKIYTGSGAGEGWKCFSTQTCP